MVGRRGFRRPTAVAPPRVLPLALRVATPPALPLMSLILCSSALWLAGCAYPSGVEPGSTLPAAAPPGNSAPATASPVFPEASPVPAASPAAPPKPAAPGTTSPGAGGYVLPDTPPPVATPPSIATPPSPPPLSTGAPAPAPGENSGILPGAAAGGALLSGPAIYLVAIDDGGNRGARFGCNDSLVAVRLPGASGSSGSSGSSATGQDSQAQGGQASVGPTAGSRQDPLATAMTWLLGPDSVPAGSVLYNALSASSLNYVSGQLDGTIAVVELSGELRQGGVCDSPRIEAQLTQTAIAATGAVRAEIRIDGRPLSEFLSLR